jgi:hypothetical protein
MIGRSLLIAVIDIAVGGAALAVYMRRDRGIVPQDRLPEALAEPLDGRQAPEPARVAQR